MLKKSLITTLFLSSLCFLGADELQKQDEKSPSPSNQPVDKEHIVKISETFGNFIGKTIKELSSTIPFDIESVVKGIHAGLKGETPPMTESEYEQAVMELRQKVIEEKGEENLKKAEEYIDKISKEKNVNEIEKGKLYITILKEGKGSEVKEHGSPLIEYKATFMDGKVFSESEANEPIVISLDKTIPGFSKGLVGAKEGEERRIIIHPELAYGKRGDLAPNSLLIFDVTVVKADAEEGHEDEAAHKNDAATPDENNKK